MQLLIAGASVRSLVASAIRAGHSVDAWDLYADADTRQLCETAAAAGQTAKVGQLGSYRQLIDIVESLAKRSDGEGRPDRVILGGGIENDAEVLKAISQRLPVAGCSIAAVEALLQDRQRLEQTFCDAGCRTVETRSWLQPGATPTDWLSKPVRGSGGFDVRVANASDFEPSRETAAARTARDRILQRRLLGESWSALFAADPNSSYCDLIGVTLQWVGDRRLSDHLFAYCGSIGPLRPAEQIQATIAELGRRLMGDFRLQGIFGVDLIVNEAGLWPVDVNPRVTASAEVFECFDRMTGVPQPFNAVQTQLGLGVTPSRSNDASAFFGKAIVFNQRSQALRVEQQAQRALLALRGDAPCGGLEEIENANVCDIPNAGAVIEPTEPMVTVRASGRSEQEVEAKLIALADQVRRCFE